MAEGLQHATITVCGIEIEIAAAVDDRYFQQCVADRDLFEPAVAVAALTLPENAVVVDCGASIGMVTAAVGRRFPDARIIAFEASPAVLPSTKATFEHNGVFPKLVTSAVGAEPGERSFYVDGNGSGWGFLNEEIADTRSPSSHSTTNLPISTGSTSSNSISKVANCPRCEALHRPSRGSAPPWWSNSTRSCCGVGAAPFPKTFSPGSRMPTRIWRRST